MPAPMQRLLISRTDAIGDVVLTLPLATILRERFPEAWIGFLGRSYTKPVIDCCDAVDQFVESEDFLKARSCEWDVIIHVFPRRDIALKAKQLGIRLRIGTWSRPYHWLTCNKLVKLKRKNADLHEAQLNTLLLAPLGIRRVFETKELGSLYSFKDVRPLPEAHRRLLQDGMRHIILHPKSQGSAREWGLEHFADLVRLLPRDHYQIFISGTAADTEQLKPLLEAVGHDVTDISGQMDLSGFISFIAACDCLVAASTGPLHIAAALGKVALGIYPSIRPMHAGRWAPLGSAATAFALSKACSDCRDAPSGCICIRSIPAAQIADHIIAFLP